MSGIDIIIARSGNEMKDSEKELNIRLVNKYSNEIDSQKKKITLDKYGVGLCSLATIIATVAGYDALTELNVEYIILFVTAFISSFGGALYFLFSLIQRVGKKSGLDIRIEDIKEFFKHYGLELEDEISKSKGL